MGYHTAAAWRRVSVPHEARQLGFTVLSLVPHRDGGPLYLVILQVPSGDADPSLGPEPPLAALSIGKVENLKMARIVGVGADEVNVTGDPGQPWEQGITVPVAPAAVG